MKTFAQLAADEVGTIYHDERKDGYRFMILCGPTSLCAYLGAPLDHPLSKIDNYEALPLDCHGGLTYAGDGVRGVEKGYYWWGWDYSHCGDRAFYELEWGRRSDETEWTVEQVKNDTFATCCDFGRLMRLAETLTNKTAP